VIEPGDVYRAKAEESLAGAESEFAAGRYNNCTNRCYYACFQAAIHALQQAGIAPKGGHEQWSHAFVQAEFVGQLINRRKRYPSDLKAALSQTLALRHAADYKRDWLTQREASRALRWARDIVRALPRE